MIGDKRLGCSPAGNGLHHWRFDFNIATLVQEVANLPDNFAPLQKDFFHRGIADEIEIALPISDFRVHESMPFLGWWPKCFGQDSKGGQSDGNFVRLSDKHRPAGANEIPKVEVTEDIELFVAEDIFLRINL
jgi:hypothetical protein